MYYFGNLIVRILLTCHIFCVTEKDLHLPMIIGIVCGVIVLIGITIIVVYKKQQARAPKDVWVSKSREPTRGKSQKQALVPDAEPAEFMNPT